MKILLIGCGSIGTKHLRNLISLGERDLVVFDVSQERVDAASSLAEDVHGSTDLEALFAEGPEVALVTTPTSLHTSYALEAAGRGCDLFVEKPVADSLEGLDALATAVSERGLVTMVGCNMRFYWAVEALSRILAEGSLGKVVSAHIEAGTYLPDWHPEEDYRLSYSARRELGGGVVLDSIHEIDYAVWLFGEVVDATGMCGRLSSLEIDTEDVADMLLRFRDGPIVSIHLDYVQRAYARGYRVAGEEGTAAWDFADGPVRLYSAREGAWSRIDPPAGWDTNDAYVAEMAHFLGCVRSRRSTGNDIEQAADVLRLALSLKEARPWTAES